MAEIWRTEEKTYEVESGEQRVEGKRDVRNEVQNKGKYPRAVCSKSV